MPEKLLCISYASNLCNVKTGQNNLWTGPKATSCPKELFAKITSSCYDYWTDDTELKI